MRDSPTRREDLKEEIAEALCAHADDGLTPIHLAASCGSVRLMKLLLAA